MADDRPRTAVRLLAREGVQAALVGLMAFGVYLATLYPGLTDIGDAAKFSFVGRVLGTPHAPGYPLYLLVSHLFSYLPWGTLACRMNALSALFAALAVGLGYLLARRLGAGRTAAVSMALALAFGNTFWSRALYAKAYTLHAALVSGGVLVLLRWHDTRRIGDLYAAAAIFALSIGNHLSVIALLPALILFPLLTDPRSALRSRTILVVALFVLLGLTQYGLIIVRTLQHAPYLEARATNLHELWSVVTARRFSHEIGAFPLSELLSTRVPLVGRLVVAEFGALGIVMVLAGFVALLVGRPRHAALVGLGAAGVCVLTANMGSNEDQGFLLPVFVLLWPVAALGLDRVIALLSRWPRHVAAGVAVGLAALLPCSQVVKNYRVNDHHAETQETAYFDVMFAALPQKAAIVDDEYRLNMLVLYKLLGESAAAGRDLRTVAADRDQVARLSDAGYEVYAFDGGRARLAESGFRFTAVDPGFAPGGAGAATRRPLYRLDSKGTCLGIGNQGWVDISRTLRSKGRTSVRIDNYRAFDSRLTIYAGSEGPLVPRLIPIGGAGTPTLAVDSFKADAPGDGARLAARSAGDGATLPEAVRASRYVTRLEVQVNDRGAYSLIALDLGEGIAAATARALVDLNNPNRATVCSHELGDVTLSPGGEQPLKLAADTTSAQFGEGWYRLENRPDGLKFRWTAERAVLILPLGSSQDRVLTISAEPLNYPNRRPGALALQINGSTLPAKVLPGGAARLSWHVPAACWRPGLNEVVLLIDGARRPSEVGLSPDNRLLGVAVTGFELGSDDGRLRPVPHGGR